MIKLLTIVVTYNAKQWIDRCFDSILNSTIKSDVYIVDNGSSDGTQEYIKKKYGQFIFVQSECNLGFGRANNLGLQYAVDNNYDYVYLLNQDAWVSNNTFEVLINTHIDNPEYGIISPLQLNSALTSFDDTFYSLCLNNKMIFQNIKGSIMKSPDESQRKIFRTEFAMAAHWLITKDCFHKVGGFSPSFPHYGEDDNYIDRCKYHGFGVGISFDTYAIHDRENRPMTKGKTIYMEYIHEIAHWSNPCGHIPCVGKTIASFVHLSLKYKSFMPLKYLYKLLCSRKEIINNKSLSKTDIHAFLSENNIN